MVYQLSRGIPRLVNSICDNALLLAFAQESQSVSIEILREVASDLDLGDVRINEPFKPEPMKPEPLKPEESKHQSNGNGNGHKLPPPLAAEPEGDLALQPILPPIYSDFRTLDSYGERKGTLMLEMAIGTGGDTHDVGLVKIVVGVALDARGVDARKITRMRAKQPFERQ